MPVIGTVADGVGSLVDSFMALPDPVKNAALIVGGIATAALGAVPLVAKIADTFGDVVGPAMKIFRGVVDNVAIGVGELATKFGASQDMGAKLAGGLAGAVTPALIGVTAAAVIGFGIWSMYQNSQKENEQHAKDFTDALNSETSAIKQNVAATIAKQLADNGAAGALEGTTAKIGIFTDAITNSGDELEQIRFYSDQLGGQQLIEQLREMGTQGNAAAAEMVRLADAGELNGTELETLARGLDDTSDSYDAGKTKAEIYRTVTDGVAIAAGKATSNTLNQIQSLKDLADELRAQTDPWFAAYKSQQAVTDAQTKLNEATSKYGPNSKEAKDAALANAEAAIGLKGDLIDLKKANLDGAGAPELAAQMEDLKRFGFDPTSQAAKNVGYDILQVGAAANTVDGTKAKVGVELEMSQAYARINYLNSVKDPVTGYISLGDVFAASQMFAKGGMVGDGPFMVGENGPELGYKIGSSVRIFSNADTKQMVASGAPSTVTTNVVVNMPPGSNGADVVDAIRSYERLNGKGWRN
jgi:hypothetical protein